VNNTAFTVAQLNSYIKGLLERDPLLSDLEIEGELSNFKQANHFYFTLKDSSAAVSCVMFASHAAKIKFAPKNGDKVIVTARVSLYEKTGQYQLYCTNMKPVGVGDLATAFVRLRDTLKNEGLFENKKAIPEKVDCVALVTSPTGAAVRDMLKIIRERNFAVKIVIVPTLVQGEQAAADIVKALTLLNNPNLAENLKPNVIILGRGGGSIEDLWAFNDENLARTIAASQIPIISAVGHETDFTISDFVADLRAATPTAAAVLAVPDTSQQLRQIQNLRQQLNQAINNRIQTYTTTIERHKRLLETLSPYTLWKRGYAAVYSENNQEIRSVEDLQPTDNVIFYLQDGIAKAQITSVTKNN